MDHERLLDVLRAENDVLRERIACLEEQLVATKQLPMEWRLTVQEARVFGVLVNRELATKEAIMSGLYIDRGVDEAEQKIVDVFICKIRKKLKPFGVRIETVWGRGYRLGPAERALYRKAA